MGKQAARMQPLGLGISNGLRRHAELLMDQQMWCFGRDIRHADGNALLRSGFEVWRAPANVVGGTGYTWSPPTGGRLTLWAFGLCFAADSTSGLLYLGRFQFQPTWRPEPDLPRPVWDTTRLPRFLPPRTEADRTRVRHLTAGACESIAAYEEWAAATLGRDYRQATVDSWFKTRFAPSRLAPSWHALARRLGDPRRVSSGMKHGRDKDKL